MCSEFIFGTKLRSLYSHKPNSSSAQQMCRCWGVWGGGANNELSSGAPSNQTPRVQMEVMKSFMSSSCRSKWLHGGYSRFANDGCSRRRTVDRPLTGEIYSRGGRGCSGLHQAKYSNSLWIWWPCREALSPSLWYAIPTWHTQFTTSVCVCVHRKSVLSEPEAAPLVFSSSHWWISFHRRAGCVEMRMNDFGESVKARN